MAKACIRGFIALSVAVSLIAQTNPTYRISVSKPATFTSPHWAKQPGESQSAVVPPNVNSACPGGAILVTNDFLPPMYPNAGPFDSSGKRAPWSHPPPPHGDTFQKYPYQGTVVYADFIDGLPGSQHASTFNEPADWQHLLGLTNDHDLIATKEGLVYYLTGAGYDGNASRTPPWFVKNNSDKTRETNRTTFGPNTRSVLVTWLSDDCGKSFQYLSMFDPVSAGNGTCANPQFRNDANQNPIVKPPWDMGGSDGQTVTLDYDTSDLYLTFQCVGYNLNNDGTPDVQRPLNSTDVAILRKGSKSFEFLGQPDVSGWRMYTRFTGNKLVLASYFGEKATVMTLGNPLPPITVQVPAGATAPGWNGFNKTNSCFGANFNGPSILTRAGNKNQLAMAYASITKAASSQLYSFSLYYLNASNNPILQWIKAATIDPVEPSQGIVLHLTAIDGGRGATLLYWYDLNFVNINVIMAKIRGRILYDATSHSDDFDISDSFNVCSAWYGDYNTAGGYSGPASGNQMATQYFYPIWIQPGGGVHFARVTLSPPGANNPGGSVEHQMSLKRQTLAPPKPGVSVDLRTLPPVREVENDRSDGLSNSAKKVLH